MHLALAQDIDIAAQAGIARRHAVPGIRQVDPRHPACWGISNVGTDHQRHPFSLAATPLPEQHVPRKEMTMDKWVTIASLVIISLMTASTARAELWCVRDFNSPQRVCVFPSGHDCFRAVRLTGGICERETATT